jgi:HTH-type transcriptional regulator, sugar sensing transcriptional regulator
MNNLDLIRQIKQLGLSENEAKCYLALYERDSLIVSEIADITGIARPNAYEAMKRLVAKGMCVAIPGQVIKYSVSPPDTFNEQLVTGINSSLDSELENLEKKKNEILEKKKEIQLTANSVVKELKTLYRDSRGNSDPLDYIEVLKNPEQVQRKFIELCHNTRKEYLQFIKPPLSPNQRLRKISPALIEETKKVNEDLFGRGVITRTLWTPEVAKSHLIGLNDTLEPLPNIEDKVIGELPIKMIVFDRKIVLYHLIDPIEGKFSMTNLIMKHPDIVNTFVRLFEFYWKIATPLEAFLASEDVSRLSKKNDHGRKSKN